MSDELDLLSNVQDVIIQRLITIGLWVIETK